MHKNISFVRTLMDKISKNANQSMEMEGMELEEADTLQHSSIEVALEQSMSFLVFLAMTLEIV